MKLNQLRKIIREEVREAIKEELQEVLTEAVKAASTPTQPNIPAYTTPQVEQPKKTYGDPIMEMLSQTKANMTNEDYKNVINADSSLAQKPNFASMMATNMGMKESAGPAPGLDISQFDFVKKAGAVYKKAVEKDKEKLGVI